MDKQYYPLLQSLVFEKQGLSYSIMSFTYTSICKNSGKAASVSAMPESISIYTLTVTNI